MERITDQWWINFNGGAATVCGKEIDDTYNVKWFLNDESRKIPEPFGTNRK